MEIESIILIGDDRVKKVPVLECGDPMVDLVTDFPQLICDLDRQFVQKNSKSISYSRRLVGERLVLAQSFLPIGIRLLIKECYRPMWVQKISWDEYSLFLRGKFPNWDECHIEVECSKLNAPLDVAPHTTGAAVDLTLVDSSGAWLDMGTDFNASPLDTQDATYTAAENINVAARANRQILVGAMRKAGFVNYPTEWWHWSYGDKYWALLTGQAHAIFGSLKQCPWDEPTNHLKF